MCVSAIEECNGWTFEDEDDLTRNTSESLGLEARVKVVNDSSQKLLISGYGQEQVRRIIINRIKSYERKFEESMSVGEGSSTEHLEKVVG